MAIDFSMFFEIFQSENGRRKDFLVKYVSSSSCSDVVSSCQLSGNGESSANINTFIQAKLSICAHNVDGSPFPTDVLVKKC